MPQSKLQPYFNQDDMAILTPPWVVVILILFSIVVLALLLWTNSRHNAAVQQIDNLNDRLSSLLDERNSQDEEELKSLTQIGTSLKLFDSRVKSLTRKLSIVANEVDAQRNATIQIQDNILQLQDVTALQFNQFISQLELLNNQSSVALTGLASTQQGQTIEIKTLSSQLTQNIQRTTDLSNALAQLKITDQFGIIAKQVATVNSKQVQQQLLISQLADDIKILTKSIEKVETK